MKLVESGDKNTITIQDETCWICDKKFNSNSIKDRRTYHHAIPREFKSKKNFKLPICQSCHYKIHNNEKLYQKRFNMIRGVFLLEEKKLQNSLIKLEAKYK